MAIRCIIFDWGGTLAPSGSRKKFLYSQDRINVVYPDTPYTLQKLHNRGYILGLISNTKHHQDEMSFALKESGLLKFLDFVILSSEPHMCRKPCTKIFQEGLRIANMKAQSRGLMTLDAKDCLYVGNNFYRDILGAISFGMRAIYKGEVTGHSSSVNLPNQELSDNRHPLYLSGARRVANPELLVCYLHRHPIRLIRHISDLLL